MKVSIPYIFHEDTHLSAVESGWVSNMMRVAKFSVNHQRKGEKTMRKKILAVVMTAVMVFSMAACGSKESDNAAKTEAPKKSEAAKTEVPKPTESVTPDTGDKLKVGLVTDVGGVNDGSFNQSAWEGLQKAGTDFGVEVNYLESATDADYAPNIESLMDEEYDLIISVGYMLAEATKAAAEANPDQKFAIIDDSTCADLPNVTCLMFKQEQASYLVGYVAGLTTKKDNVGFVLGMANETMNQFGYGYLAGVLDANSKCKIQQFNANSFADSAIGKSSANTAITNGADIIFHAAGGTGLGVIEACKEAGIYAIGVDSDQSKLAPEAVITSAMKRVDNAVYDTTEALIKETLKGGVKTYDLSIGGVDIAPTKDLLSADVVTKIEDIKAKIISGDIVVPATQKDFEAKYGNVYELD